MRKVSTGTKDFRENLDEIAGLMAYEITRDLPVHTVDIVTPVSPTKAQELAKDIVLVPILRAGLGMVNGIRDLIPTAKVGHIGLYRDEKTLEPHEYFAKSPSNMPDSIVMVLDPMLATGGSASAAVTMLKKRNAKLIKLVCLVGAPEGVKRMQEDHPDVDIYLAALDEKLNEHGYIVPGLGDAGDRIFGTK
jgi:uracil phosphoribosyltransferase